MTPELIFYSSFLCFPFLFICCYRFKILKKTYINNKFKFYLNILLFFITLLFIYSRFIEPNIILIQENSINVWFKSKIVVISDLHLWVYKNENFLRRVVDKINTIKNIDAVLIAWDLSFFPPNNLDNLFSPLRDIKYSTYAVLWNHDKGNPGVTIEKEIKEVLENNNVTYLHNKVTIIPNTNIKLLWLWDNWELEDDINLINRYKKEDNLIVLTHNPDTTLNYSRIMWIIADITITGHTHWWQIRIPFIYKLQIPTIWDFDEWIYSNSETKLFVSSGLWEVGLPMRLGIPPVIDILKLE